MHVSSGEYIYKIHVLGENRYSPCFGGSVDAILNCQYIYMYAGGPAGRKYRYCVRLDSHEACSCVVVVFVWKLCDEWTT